VQLGDLWSTRTAPGDNTLVFKATYWFSTH